MLPYSGVVTQYYMGLCLSGLNFPAALLGIVIHQPGGRINKSTKQDLNKNMALIVQKLWGGKKLSKSVSATLRLTKQKKFRIPLSSVEEGGGKALMASH